MTNIDADDSVDRITENFETEEAEEEVRSASFLKRIERDSYKIFNEKLNEVLLQFMNEEELMNSIDVS